MMWRLLVIVGKEEEEHRINLSRVNHLETILNAVVAVAAAAAATTEHCWVSWVK